MTTLATPNVQIHVDERGPPPTPQATSGGIKISVGDRVLTRVTDTEQYDSGTPWSPEYVGTHLRMDLTNLARIATAVRRGELNRYKIVEAEIEATLLSVAVEQLSESYLRLAFHTRTHRTSGEPDIPVDAECGYSVVAEEFCTAVRDAIREFVTTLESIGVDTDHHSLNELRGAIETLRTNNNEK